MKAETDERERLLNDTANLLAQSQTDMDEAWWRSQTVGDLLLELREDHELWKARVEWDRATKRLLNLLDERANEERGGDNDDED